MHIPETVDVPTVVGIGSPLGLEYRELGLENFYELQASPPSLMVAIVPPYAVGTVRMSLNGHLDITRINQGLYFCHSKRLPIHETPLPISGLSKGSSAVYYCVDPDTGLLIQYIPPWTTTSSHYHERTRETFLGFMGECRLRQCDISSSEIIENDISGKSIELVPNPNPIAHQLKAFSYSGVFDVIVCDPPIKSMDDHFPFRSLW